MDRKGGGVESAQALMWFFGLALAAFRPPFLLGDNHLHAFANLRTAQRGNMSLLFDVVVLI